MSDREKRIRATGFSRITDVDGKDFPEVNLFLQKRWEDKDGNIFAKRIGTMVVRYYNTTDDWRNNVTYSIMYGDITGDPAYKPHMMRLQVEERYAINSKGESVPVKEVHGERKKMFLLIYYCNLLPVMEVLILVLLVIHFGLIM